MNLDQNVKIAHDTLIKYDKSEKILFNEHVLLTMEK